MKIAYSAGGYVGLTGAIHYAKAGAEAIIYDPDQAVVDAINSGNPKAGSFLAYLGTEALRVGTQIKATSHIDEVLDADAHIIAVPSERRGEPWMDVVLASFRLLADASLPGAPIIVESTLMPGMASALRMASAGHPWAIAPRRDWFADASKNMETLTRIVGRDKHHHAALEPLFTLVCRDIHWTSPETAEVTKALENALLHLPVMLIHELALFYPDYDIVEAAELASTHWRFRSLGKLYLGIGTGGRCVPIGPKYLAGRGGSLLSDAIELDDAFADEAITRCLADYGGDQLQRAVVLGVAYRPGFSDAGNSPGMRAARALRKLDHLTIIDPYFDASELYKLIADYEVARARVTSLESAALASYDLVVLSVAHPEFVSLVDRLRPGAIVIDATGAWEDKRTDLVYIRPGRPGWIPKES